MDTRHLSGAKGTMFLGPSATDSGQKNVDLSQIAHIQNVDVGVVRELIQRRLFMRDLHLHLVVAGVKQNYSKLNKIMC